MVEGSSGAVRLFVKWGEKLLDVRQVADTKGITAGMLFGESVAATGLSPETKLFEDGGPLQKFGTVNLGPLTLCAEDAIPAERVSTISPPQDYSFFKVVAISVLVTAAILVSIAISPHDYEEAADAFMHQDVIRIVKTMPVPTVDLTKTVAAAKASAPDKEGLAGDKKAIAKSSDKESIAKGPRTIDQMRKAGVGLLAVMNGASIAQVLNGDNGDKINTALNTLQGNHGVQVATNGFEGMGRHGQDEGGGGDRFHIGSIGTKNGLDPHGTGISIGKGGGHHVTPDGGKNVRIIGGLSKDVIAKEIRKHQSEIRYCYESALQRSPDLAGKVSVLFTIDPTGDISDANLAETTLNNETAEQCMLSKIRRWKFPAPEGGGVVTVTFPWVFSSAGNNPENEE